MASDSLARYESAAAIGIDIPIGTEPGRFRSVDAAAKALLGPRRSSLFAMPPTEVIQVADFAHALTLCRELTGKGLSKQSHSLRKKILEVAAAVKQDSRIIEVHPELSFRALANKPLPYSKKSWNGAWQRHALLDEAGIHLPTDLGPALREANVDDVLDAAAAAWTAHRYALGRAECVQPVIRDEAGRKITIWY
jgi:predicted RNase H-like nuclease